MSARPAPRSTVLPDVTVDDVKTACEQIHALAEARGWDLKRLGKEARHAWQSFNNWKQGHQPPKVNLLQDFAAAVGKRIRVILEPVADSQGGTVVISPGAGGDIVPRTPGDDELAKALGLAALTDPGVRRAATLAAREAAVKAVAEHSKRAPAHHPHQPTAEENPSRSRRKTNSGRSGT